MQLSNAWAGAESLEYLRQSLEAREIRELKFTYLLRLGFHPVAVVVRHVQK